MRRPEREFLNAISTKDSIKCMYVLNVGGGGGGVSGEGREGWQGEVQQVRENS
jgi:hypothetical protein